MHVETLISVFCHILNIERFFVKEERYGMNRVVCALVKDGYTGRYFFYSKRGARGLDFPMCFVGLHQDQSVALENFLERFFPRKSIKIGPAISTKMHRGLTKKDSVDMVAICEVEVRGVTGLIPSGYVPVWVTGYKGLNFNFSSSVIREQLEGFA